MPVARRGNNVRMTSLRHRESIIVARPPEYLYDMVSDVTRMGEWSPVCRACWWDDGDGPRPGAWFTGRNELPERAWETRSRVIAAERGREFAFVVGGSWVRWGYTFTPVDGGTEVTESWEFLPGPDRRARRGCAHRHPPDPRGDQEDRGIGSSRIGLSGAACRCRRSGQARRRASPRRRS